MTVINTNNISGINSITAQSDSLNFYTASGNTLSIGANVNATGVSTFSNGIVVSAGTTAAPSISPSGDSNTGIFFPSADTVAIGEGGAEVLRVDSSGRVGIATNSPTSTLDVGGEVTIRRTAPGSEGGQLNLARASDNASAWYIDVYGSTSTPDLRFVDATAAVVRMQIDGSGRVTKPSQPAFHVKLNNVAQYSTTGTIPFTQVLTNIGSHYSTSTYTFTAPVAGTYSFFVKAFIEVASRTSIDIRVNGSQRQGVYGPQSQGDMLFGNLIITLAANDSVIAFLRGGTIFGDGTSINYDAASFSGYLIG